MDKCYLPAPWLPLFSFKKKGVSIFDPGTGGPSSGHGAGAQSTKAGAMRSSNFDPQEYNWLLNSSIYSLSYPIMQTAASVMRAQPLVTKVRFYFCLMGQTPTISRSETMYGSQITIKYSFVIGFCRPLPQSPLASKQLCAPWLSLLSLVVPYSPLPPLPWLDSVPLRAPWLSLPPRVPAVRIARRFMISTSFP